ncbi:cell wall-active antibiotics response protein LiaF [Halalkalibacter oceani]|uniref:Cell wall-active antibiotics response protein LiaF n=1 Tax=Halalkalibacter oceani TaxID=1653776 RepID=A0A9X2DLB5_9BACI|nr:cell wall-active antibiotics response protein LiaF [Halalkalibacter oceani]MCM3712649.1 cell wall-active antibiotics response protein LiaF [Halalkalibacter oceani]
MKKQTLFGLVIVIIGLNLLFHALRISTASFVAPLIFFVLGMFFYQRKHTFLSVIFFIISVSILFDLVLGMNFMGLLVAAVILYYGVKLVKSPSYKKKEKREKKKRRKREQEPEQQEPAGFRERREPAAVREEKQSPAPLASQEKAGKEYFTATVRRSWIGDIHYRGEAFELSDLTIWNGIGDVRIDLSRAIIPEGETVIIVQGGICQVDFYVPNDLATSIQASSLLGSVSLFHEKHEGLNSQLAIATKGYKSAPRRVKLVLSTVIGEVKVRDI